MRDTARWSSAPEIHVVPTKFGRQVSRGVKTADQAHCAIVLGRACRASRDRPAL